MVFIGQEVIWRELELIIQEMQAGRNFNIIIRGPSGVGKTKLAIIIANSVDENSVEYVIPTNDVVEISFENRIIIIDEVHELKSPEFLYPIMDSKQHIFILCSNETGELKEPLVNRCIDLVFQPYSMVEIAEIIRRDFLNIGMNINDECLQEIAINSNLIPRIARQYAERLGTIFKSIGVPETKEEIKESLLNYLQVIDGLNPLHRRYLEFLNKHTRASLDLISFGTRIDKNTIRKEIEPILINKLLIKISSKGREIWK